MKKLIAVVSVLALVVIASGVLVAQGRSDQFYAMSERFGYTGTVSVYNTLADANSGRHARCSAVVWPQGDGSIWVVRNLPWVYTDYNNIMTNWYSNNGHNPNNQNPGFFQLYDDNADAWQNQRAWWSRDLDTFTVTAKGKNASYPSNADPQDYARLWNACAPAGSGESTKGTFLRYEYLLVATGLNGVRDADGFVSNMTDATNFAGYFVGIFLNDSKTSPASNGYYVFNLAFNNTSWAASHAYAADDYFGGRIVNAR